MLETDTYKLNIEDGGPGTGDRGRETGVAVRGRGLGGELFVANFQAMWRY
jgi:hypothetical protein